MPFITPFQTGPKHLQVSLSRAQLEKLADPLLMKTKEPCEACTKDAGLKNDEINEIPLVNGMTRMPLVMEVVRSIFGKDPSNSVNPDEAVAIILMFDGHCDEPCTQKLEDYDGKNSCQTRRLMRSLIRPATRRRNF